MTNSEIILIAINRLVNNPICNIGGTSYSDIEWLDDRSIFSESQFNQAVSEVKSEIETAVSNRVYPDISEQLDALWHSMNAGLLPKDNPFYTMIKEVKDKYPKPE